MAGDWIKMELGLPDKPETLAITAAMGWDDPDLTVGKLMRVFRWFDQHTVDGNAASVTPALLDRIIGVTGFAQAMSKTGWLLINEAGISLTNFDRHNGATAKSRVLTAKRVANHRSSVGNAASVTSPLAREEKRRKKTLIGEPVGFADFWKAYPRKDDKQSAMDAWAKLGPVDILLPTILQAVAVQSRSETWTKESGQYIPMPASWLNKRRWEDQGVKAATTKPWEFA